MNATTFTHVAAEVMMHIKARSRSLGLVGTVPSPGVSRLAGALDPGP